MHPPVVYAPAGCLLDVAQQRHAAEDPVVWVLIGFQLYGGDVGQVGATRLLVDWAHVQARVVTCK